MTKSVTHTAAERFAGIHLKPVHKKVQNPLMEALMKNDLRYEKMEYRLRLISDFMAILICLVFEKDAAVSQEVTESPMWKDLRNYISSDSREINFSILYAKLMTLIANDASLKIKPHLIKQVQTRLICFLTNLFSEESNLSKALRIKEAFGDSLHPQYKEVKELYDQELKEENPNIPSLFLMMETIWTAVLS